MAFRARGGENFANNKNIPPLRIYSEGSSLLRHVRALEDRTEAAAKANSAEERSLALQRPAYGTLGKRVCLWANYVALAPGKGHLFYRYAVQITRIKDNEGGKKQRDTKLQAEQSSNNGAEELATQLADQLALDPNSNDPPNHPDIQAGNGDSPVQPGGMKRAAIIAHLLSRNRDLRDRCDRGAVASDYRDSLVSTAPLEDLVYIVEYVGVRSNHKLERYKLALVEPSDVQNPLRLDDLLAYLDSHTQSSAPAIHEAVFAQVLNLWLRQFSKLKESSEPPAQKVVGSKAYPLTGDTKLPKEHPNVSFTHSLKLGVSSIRGYFSSIRFGAGKAWVNINVTHGAFFDNIPLGEWIRAAGYTRSGDYEKLHGVIKGLRVALLHRGVKYDDESPEKKVLVKVISGLATTSDGVPQDDKQRSFPANPYPPKFQKGSPRYGVQCAQVRFFDQSEEKYVTVYEHFKQHYAKYCPREDELVVNLGSALRPAYYPVSVCKVLRGQNYHPKLTDTQTQEMIKFAVLRPDSSVDCITMDGLDRIGLKNSTPHARLLNPASGLASVEGRRLAMPDVKYDKTNVGGTPGKWNLVDVGKYSGQGRQAVWAILPMGEFSWYNEQYREMDKELRQLMSKRGFDLANHHTLDDRCLLPPRLTRNLPTETRDKELTDHFQHLKREGYNLLFVLLPNKGAELYHAIKAVADITVGIHTVCVVESKAGKRPKGGKGLFDLQLFDNILLKANLKQGGINHKLEFPSATILSDLGAMVLGLDVTHSPPAARKAETPPSIIGMVANADKHLAQWPATIAFQERENQEIVTSLQSFQTLLGPHLDRYHRLHKKYPRALILYRDGVSEGQYSQVASNEYEGIRAVCATKYGGKDQEPPMISIIVVGKRHHTRFYPSTEADADRKGNTRPGTVVDRSITSQFLWEFFLQAHEAIQGTARPAHYVVVVDEFFRSTFGVAANRPKHCQNAADVLEGFTHALSYALGRSTRSVGVCTPARLADKVCDRARCYTAAGLTQGQIRIADDLKDSMFYI